jgi:multiple sugar transport system ATP-binding protein
MTLGDRVAVMRAGLIQQVDTPANLYENPQNLFVAGFIGSPSMNFLPGRLDDGRLTLPVGSFPLPATLRPSGPDGHDVIVGIRPEHFEDAAVEGDVPDRARFRATLDVVESMGSELYAYFDVKVRHEALSDRAGCETPPPGRRSGLVKLRAA